MFSGFPEPTTNYFRLPDALFEGLQEIRGHLPNSRMFGSVLHVLLYLFARTWNRRRSGGVIHLSLQEIRHGYRFPDGTPDSMGGTGLSTTTISKALTVLVALGVVEKIPPRRPGLSPGYRIRTRPSETPAASEGGAFAGFPPLQANYFRVPIAFLQAVRGIRSGVLLWVLLYSFRHGCGYQNPKGIWLTFDDFLHGRRKANGARYDPGLQCEETALYRALKEGVARGLLVYRYIRTPDGEILRQYNLHLQGMQVSPEGEFAGWQGEQATDDNAAPSAAVPEGGEMNTATGEVAPPTCDFEAATCEVAPPTCDFEAATCEVAPSNCDFNHPKAGKNTFQTLSKHLLETRQQHTAPRRPSQGGPGSAFPAIMPRKPLLLPFLTRSRRV